MSAPRPPSVDAVLRALDGRASERDRDAVVASARDVVAEERRRLADGAGPRGLKDLATATVARLAAFGRPGLDPGPTAVINATGVLLHTNLGRAAWPVAAIDAANRAASGPTLLELDPATGRRGRRAPELVEHVVALTGAEDALVVNNNAAALALVVGLAGRGGVAVSRGELVEIGGGVRIPEVVRRAGARLVEVGTTNRTRVADFEAVVAGGTARLVLRVHPSNFVQSGFVEAPEPVELAALVHAHGGILVDDLGSGALLDTARFGLAHEPLPAERLEAGADLVTFSGDKLLGGPQAGLVAGRRGLVARLRRDPLARAMRPDKVILAALAATLALYRAGLATREVPVWRQIATPASDLEARARAVASVVGDVAKPVRTEATIGGGSLPGQMLPSWGLAISTASPDRSLATLRRGEPPVIGRIADDRVVLDLRTVDPADDGRLAEAVHAAIGSR
ncbi:MAG TPA: L-seryl-tRNA(Sec) selenium transferase [Candidatus Deferrimicrobiaceae bacterium]|nr:L-seryl-tRNA(Sec) selenium transferase [Candidatus Deferrimicrobiaceae bacterium]